MVTDVFIERLRLEELSVPVVGHNMCLGTDRFIIWRTNSQGLHEFTLSGEFVASFGRDVFTKDCAIDVKTRGQTKDC